MTSATLAPTIPSTDPLVALRRQHQALLARMAKEAPSPEERRAFMAELTVAGRVVSGDRARGALENMLFYWAADATTRGEQPKSAPPPRLDDFVPEAGALSEGAIGGAAEDAAAPGSEGENAPKLETAEAGPAPYPSPASNASPALEGLLGSILSAPNDNPRAPTSGAPTSGLSNILGGNILGGLVGSVVQGGTILAQVTERLTRPSSQEASVGNLATEKQQAPEPGAPASPAPTPDSVPISEVEIIARARAILRFSAYARQWRRAEADKQADFLLKGSALAEASLYVDEDPDIRAHVEASMAARDDAERLEKQRIQHELTKNRWRATVFAVIALIAVALAVLLFFQLNATTAALKAKDKAHKAELAAIEKQKEAERQKGAALNDLSMAIGPGGGDLPNKIERLEKRQAVITSDSSNVVASRPPTLENKPPVPVPSTPAQACTGYLWFGSPAESRIAGGRDPLTLKAGDRVTINQQDDIRLRERAPPLPNYVMAPQIGLVPAGSSVTVTETLEPYRRPSGLQIWARVSVSRQFCTSVFLQYAGRADRLDEIKTRLQAIGVQTPPAEQLETAATKAEVRYYWPEDAPVARQVAETLKEFTRDRQPLKLTPLLDFPAKAKAKPTTIEVWLDVK